MRLTTLRLASTLACLTQLGAAVSNSGTVYSSDPSAPPSPPPDFRFLSPEIARVVLAQRAGVEEYHVERGISEEQINVINTYGSQTPLFGRDGSTRRAFVLGFREVDEQLSALPAIPHSFAVASAPTNAETVAFFWDLAAQADPSLALVDRRTTEQPTSVTTQQGDIFHLASSAADFAAKTNELHALGHYTITALWMQNTTTPSTAANSKWGTYRMPNSQHPLHKRSSQRQTAEEPLSAPTTHSTIPLTSLNNSTTTPLASSNQSTPLPGILPACFRSLTDCQTSTRNCTGHGTCRLHYTNRDAASGANGACYSCSCTSTVHTSADGKKKTTVWGGPACQKKDVSVAFWLIALFTVGLVGVVTFAVGTVYSMGSEELPSVIGAGVSGPVRK